MALDAAPGLNRAFGFEKLENFDGKTWRALQDKARARRKPAALLPIHGSDKSGTVLGLARENLAAAGHRKAPFSSSRWTSSTAARPRRPGIVVMNPPYGERQATAEELAAFYPRLGDALKQRYAGWTAYILTADLRLRQADRPQGFQTHAALQRRARVPAVRVPDDGGQHAKSETSHRRGRRGRGGKQEQKLNRRDAERSKAKNRLKINRTAKRQEMRFQGCGIPARSSKFFCSSVARSRMKITCGSAEHHSFSFASDSRSSRTAPSMSPARNAASAARPT